MAKLQHQLMLEEKKRRTMELKYEEVNKTVEDFDQESMMFQ